MAYMHLLFSDKLQTVVPQSVVLPNDETGPGGTSILGSRGA